MLLLGELGLDEVGGHQTSREHHHQPQQLQPLETVAYIFKVLWRQLKLVFNFVTLTTGALKPVAQRNKKVVLSQR